MTNDTNQSKPSAQVDLASAARNSETHIVLVETLESLNIGSAARAMKNFGYSNLHLVGPREFNIEKAKITACWAEDLLRAAQVHATLEEALGGMEEVVGFSAKSGTYHPGKLLLPEWVEQQRCAPKRKLALVFGPEDKGLAPQHIEHCRWLVRIPTTAECPSLNLAQSVLLGLYELSRLQWGELTGEHAARELPDWNQYYQLDRLASEVLTECGFYREGSPEPIPGLVKNLFRRMDLDYREMTVMLALFGRIRSHMKRIDPA